MHIRIEQNPVAAEDRWEPRASGALSVSTHPRLLPATPTVFTERVFALLRSVYRKASTPGCSTAFSED